LAILVVDSVEKIYDGRLRPAAALRGVSFEAAAGEFTALMGPSGCGKSTLLHLIGGMDFPSRGVVLLDGVALNELGEEALAFPTGCCVIRNPTNVVGGLFISSLKCPVSSPSQVGLHTFTKCVHWNKETARACCIVGGTTLPEMGAATP